MKKIAVILSGCGFKDGAEVTEAVSTLIHLSELGVDYEVFAPTDKHKITNHLDDSSEPERSVLAESARITRGKISPLSELKESDFDSVILPGGFGVAKNLSNWAEKGAQCEVNTHLENLLKEFHQASKPIGAICISPAIVARVLGGYQPTVTIGNDPETSQEIEKTGSDHVECRVDDYITDRENKVISTPAYMYEARPSEVFQGIGKMMRELVEMS